MVSYGLFCFSIKKLNPYPRNKLYAIPRFPNAWPARFQVTTKDSVFAIKVWMFETKDCVLEMTMLNIMFALNSIECFVGIFEVMNRIMKLDDQMSP